jgi:hypothetical protein
MRGKKQSRRRYVMPRDPRTPGQMRARAALGAASKAYSDCWEVTEEERRQLRAAGSKLWSRRRLGQRGRLTGQQVLIRLRCAGQEGQIRRPKAEIRGPTRGGRGGTCERSTWERCRVATAVLARYHREGWETGWRSRNGEWRMENGERGGRGIQHEAVQNGCRGDLCRGGKRRRRARDTPLRDIEFGACAP